MNLAILDQDWSGLLDTKLLILKVSKNANVHYHKVNIRSPDEVVEAMFQVQSHFNHIDYAVNCAGKSTAFLQVLDIFTRSRNLRPYGTFFRPSAS